VSPQRPSGAVTAGYRLMTVFLVGAVAFLVVAVASVAVGLARGGDSLLYGETLRVPLQLSPDDAGPLPPGMEFTGWPDVTVVLRNPTSGQMLLRSAVDLGPAVLLVAGLWLLQGFARSVRAGDPFGPENVQRLRRLGFLLVLGAPAVELVNSQLRLSLYNDLPPNRFGDVGVAGFSLPAGALLGGLGAFVLAEVFAHGLRLREDVEGTV
jgi:Protein of unknown function (DUF2975)